MPTSLATALPTLAEHAKRLQRQPLRTLLEDPERNACLRRRLGPLLIDLSRQRLDLPALAALGEYLQASNWQAARETMFAGEQRSAGGQRTALHTALRAGASHLPASVPSELRQEIEASLLKVERLVQAVHQGEAASLGLPTTITDIVHIGIGGSDLGSRMATHALAAYAVAHIRSHFLTNIDGQAIYDLMTKLNPKRCLVVVVSKSFDTQETLLNAEAMRSWITRAHNGDVRAAAKHFLAVSARSEAAIEWGVLESHVYPMWDYVSGRTSLCSAVGLTLALMIGMESFRALLSGAAQMDDHFREAEWPDNLPVLLALTDLWNRNLQGYASRAIVPYANRLAELPAYLQQLEMESLGKSVTTRGVAVDLATGPVVWGSVGSSAQHQYFQALHQGSEIVPVEFIASVKPTHPLRSHQDALLAHMLAQATALALGGSAEAAHHHDVQGQPEDCAASNLWAAQRRLPGNRPSTVILLDELTPRTLGSLIALYEHKVFLLAHSWGINAYDQWGLQLGKQLAREILPALDGEPAELASFDPATRALIEEIQMRREG